MVKTAANPLGLTKKVFDDLQAQLAAGPLSAKLLKYGTLKTYKGFPHGMPTTKRTRSIRTCWRSSKASHRKKSQRQSGRLVNWSRVW
jgi:hypothetical protein